MTKIIYMVVFSLIGFIIGILLNKYFNKNFVNKIYSYSRILNIKLIISIYFIISTIAAIYNIDIGLFELCSYTVDNNNTNTLETINIDSNNNSSLLRSISTTITSNINTALIKDNNLTLENLENPRVKISVTYQQLRNILDKGIILGGFRLGMEAAKKVNTLPGKILTGVAASTLSQAWSALTVVIHDKILLNKESEKNNNSLSNNINNNSNKQKNLDEYQIQILDDYNNFSFFFTFIILNTYLARLLSKLDINKYLDPNSKNKIIKLLRYLILRYIRIWSKSTQFIFILSCLCLLISLTMTKLCLFNIIY